MSELKCSVCKTVNKTGVDSFYYQAGDNGDEPICGACLADYHLRNKHRIAALEAKLAEKDKQLAEARERIDLLVDKGADMWAVLECHVPNCKELEAWDEALDAVKGGGK